MVSNLLEEHNGYLRLTADEFEAAKGNYPLLTRHQVRAYLEYGENKEGRLLDLREVYCSN